MGRNKETLLLLAIVFPYGLLLVVRYLWNMTVVFCAIAFQEKICYQWELFSRHQLTFLPLNFFGILSEKNLFSHSLRLFLAFLLTYFSPQHFSPVSRKPLLFHPSLASSIWKSLLGILGECKFILFDYFLRTFWQYSTTTCICSGLYVLIFTICALEWKRNSDTGYSMDAPWRHYAQWNTTLTGRQRLSDSTYRRSPEKSDPDRQEAECWSQGPEWMES